MSKPEPAAAAESPGEEAALLAAAIAGDRPALTRLLMVQYDALSRRVAARLPARLQATEAVEDILQTTFCQAFRDIGRFKPQGEDAFGHWLGRIAENRLLDAVKRCDRQKRGGEVQMLPSSNHDSRLSPLFDWIAANDTSPSSVAARNEALHALEIALASLPEAEHAAIRLRLIEGKSLEETAQALARSPDAVRGLVHRGKQQLQDAMGRASQWLKMK